MNRCWRNKVHYYDKGDKKCVRQVQLCLYFSVTSIESENEDNDAVKKLKTYMQDTDSVHNTNKTCFNGGKHMLRKIP